MMALMHVDSLVNLDDVLKLLDDLGVGCNSKIIIVPGILCNDFDYHSLISYSQERGDAYFCYRLNGMWNIYRK